jgi:hypothetical protein
MLCIFSASKPALEIFCILPISFPPNVVAEWLALLFHIREVLGSNLGLKTNYPDWGFPGFLQSLQVNARIIP